MSKRVVYLHPKVRNIEAVKRSLLVKDNDISSDWIWDEDNPQYVFVTEWIFVKRKWWKRWREYYRKRAEKIFIFVGCEALYPDMNMFDYAITFSIEMRNHERISRMPLRNFYFKEDPYKENEVNMQTADMILKQKNSFCDFVYSNPDAHPMRDRLFYALQEYKFVESWGRHLNNMGNNPTRSNPDWLDLQMRIKERSKFSLAIENASFEGYTSEKLMSSFRAHSIPIYWGNPKVAEEFNSEAFINVHEYDSIDAVIERVKVIDRDDELWKHIICQPWVREGQRKEEEKQLLCYKHFLEKIFQSDIRLAVRRPSGYWINEYSKFYFRNNHPDTVCRRIQNGIRREIKRRG